ncbi:MAG: alpha-glucuronidase, partial [Prevotella sp.]|nr:alpha-glucuronidase [Prevotella sp.]
MKRNFIILASFILIAVQTVSANDGHGLWLNMRRNESPSAVVLDSKSLLTNSIAQTAADELRTYWKGDSVVLMLDSMNVEADGFRVSCHGGRITLSSRNANGLLYGAYDMLRKQEQNGGRSILHKDTTYCQVPDNALRILNHWDNPDGTIERGYAGRSIFWKEDGIADLNVLKEYGRACASVGINASVLNNVNAKPLMLGKQKLSETKRIADALRPYGIKVFLAVNFATPKVLGGLPTADPLDAKVQAWWKKKAKEIYRMIPDFGGFLVKANSEGEPGPMDYGRTHVDGANMLAAALKPYGGIVMWRAFVYAPSSSDRASQAYDEFMPFDGQFAENVIIQIKNGPIDFQPREPASPLFFAMKHTAIMP